VPETDPITPTHETATTTTPAPPIDPAHASAAPLLLWISIQLLVTILAAARVPLAARYPEPAEQLAPHLLLGAQVVAAAVLFPFLLGGWRVAVKVVAVAIPFQLAAGLLAGFDVASLATSAAIVTLWIVALSLWAAVLRSEKSRAIGIALASCLTLGAGMIHYLRLEFDPATATPKAFELASPLFTALGSIDASPPREGWILLISILMAGFVATLIRARQRVTV
jgi:hypothetical protein